MEPDFDKLASNKIREAELKVTPWNKEAVWQNVMSETRRSDRSYFFQYSAAAAVLLLFLFGVQQIANDKKSRYADVNKSSHQQITEPQKKVIELDTCDNIINKIVQPGEKKEVASLIEIQQNISVEIFSVNHDEKAAGPIIEPIVADFELNEEEFLLPETDTIREQKIRPIVGVITKSHFEQVAKVKRKKSLHKLESLEPVPWENVPNALVFARKK